LTRRGVGNGSGDAADDDHHLQSCAGADLGDAGPHQAATDDTDLPGGIRAAIIDRDRRPVWSPATLDEVTPEMVGSHFAPLGAEDLDLQGVPAPHR